MIDEQIPTGNNPPLIFQNIIVITTIDHITIIIYYSKSRHNIFFIFIFQLTQFFIQFCGQSVDTKGSYAL